MMNKQNFQIENINNPLFFNKIEFSKSKGVIFYVSADLYVDDFLIERINLHSLKNLKIFIDNVKYMDSINCYSLVRSIKIGV